MSTPTVSPTALVGLEAKTWKRLITAEELLWEVLDYLSYDAEIYQEIKTFLRRETIEKTEE